MTRRYDDMCTGYWQLSAGAQERLHCLREGGTRAIFCSLLPLQIRLLGANVNFRKVIGASALCAYVFPPPD